MFDSRVVHPGEISCQSLLGVKGLINLLLSVYLVFFVWFFSLNLPQSVYFMVTCKQTGKSTTEARIT